MNDQTVAPAPPAAAAPTSNRGRRPRSWSVTIGRVAGIDIRLHASFALIVLLFAAGSVGLAGLLSNLTWLAIIFACVLVHELAHSLLARRRGATVRAIVLLPIGGVSELEHLPSTPRDEFDIAVVGPLASYALALAALTLLVIVGQPLLPFDLVAGSLLHRLFWFNLAVGTFNLLPAFPMDGGRVLRAVLERRHDRVWATRRAARIGRWFGIATIAVGLLTDLWLVLIGAFIAFGAAAEESATIAHVRLAGVRVAQVMRLDPVVLPVTVSVGEARELARRSSQDSFAVVDGERYVGVVGLDELTSAPGDTSVGALPTTPVTPVRPDDDLGEILDDLLRQGARTAHPVVDHGVVGVLRLDDALRRSDAPVRGRVARV